MRIYGGFGTVVIDGIVATTSDELIYSRSGDDFTLGKRGTSLFTVTEDYSVFQDRYGNNFSDADDFETHLSTLNISDTPTSGGSSTNVIFGGRAQMYTDNRWVGFTTNYGVADRVLTQNHGTGATPNVVWNSLGVETFPSGTVINSIEISGRVNNSEVSNIDCQISKQGDFASGWSNNTGADNVEIMTKQSIGMTTSFGDWSNTINHTLTKKRTLVICFQPIGTITSNRYFYFNGILNVTYP